MMTFDSKITIQVNENVYIKSPDTSELGRKIVKGSIELIDEIGFEDFNFKKLAIHISSTEASIYRYFESKHSLLSYLVLWYWGWQQYRMTLRITNIEDPLERLKRAIMVLTEQIEEDSTFSQINEVLLNKIVIAESSKIFLNKKVDQDNDSGFFLPYKELVQVVSDIILEINANFKYPHMLVTTIIEGSHHQRYFAEHLPRLTNVVEGEDAITSFYQEMVTKIIANK